MRKVVKNIFLSLATAVAVLTLSQTYAADEGNNIFNALEWDNANWANSIVASGPTATSVILEFPPYVANGEQIMNYAVTYTKGTTISVAELPAIKKVSFEAEAVKVVNGKINLLLEWLEASSKYYFVVEPINKEGTALDPSTESSFDTTAPWMGNNNTTNNTTDPSIDPLSTDEPLAGSADIASANFTFVLSGNRVTLRWNTINGASRFSFSTKELTQASYTKLADVAVSTEEYTFVIGRVGSHLVRIVPTDANGNIVWAETVLNIKIDSVTTPTGTGTPATGAWLNLILMSTFLMMLIYVVYRFRTTK